MDKPSSFGDLVREMGLFDSGTKQIRRSSTEAPPAPHGLLPPEGAASEQTDPPAVYQRNGISEKHLRRYRRWSTEDTLDLHGLTVLQAHREIENFLAKSLSPPPAKGRNYSRDWLAKWRHSARQGAILVGGLSGGAGFL